MGRLNGRDRSFQKGNRGVHRIPRAPEEASLVINHAGSAHAVVTRITERAGTAIAVHGNVCGAMRRNFTVRLFRANAKPAWQPTSLGSIPLPKEIQRLRPSPHSRASTESINQLFGCCAQRRDT